MENDSEQERKAMKRNIIIIILVLLLIFMSGCTGEQKSVAGDTSIASPAVYNTNGNIQNGGLITYNDSHVYFLVDTGNGKFGFTKSGTDKLGLYQANPDGSNIKLIGATSIETSLNVYSGAIYGAGDDGIYRVDLKTKKEKKIIDGYELPWKSMQIVGNKLYYTDGTTIYAANLNGDSKTKIVSGPAPVATAIGDCNALWYFAINGQDIYYVINSYQHSGDPQNAMLYKRKLNTNNKNGEEDVIYKGNSIYNIQFSGSNIYYLDLDNLNAGYVYNGTRSLYKNGVKLKNGSSIVGYHILNHTIYFMRYEARGDTNTLTKADLKLASCKTLQSKMPFPVEDWVYADKKSIFWYPNAENIKMLNLKTNAVKPFFDMPSEDN